MSLQLNTDLAAGYKSPSQRARRITEGWFAQNSYCPACTSPHLSPTPANTRVVDFLCPACGAEFQLKAKSTPLGKKVRDAAYAPMIERVLANRSPHFAFLQYDRSGWRVRKLLLVPGHFITTAVIERCPPLSAAARRARWVGCNILLDRIPDEGRLMVVSESRTMQQNKVRLSWARFSWMKRLSAESRGWTADVLRCVGRFGRREFSLAQMYEFKPELAALHPANTRIRPKIRQQLQVLRDKGIIRFLGRGHYVAV